MDNSIKVGPIAEAAPAVSTAVRLSPVLNRENGYAQVRLLAALSVIVSHAVVIVGGGAQPLAWAAYDLGAIAVNVFFVLSGVMVSRSYALGPDPKRFLLARVLRIYPALLVSAIVTAFVIGPFGTNLGVFEFLTHPQTLLYPFNVLWDFGGAQLPNVFTGNETSMTNEPLWTIKYELLAYFGLVCVAALGLLRPVPTMVAWAALLVAMCLGIDGSNSASGLLGHVVRFAFCFLSGVLAFQFAERLRLSVGLGLVLAVSALLIPVWPLSPVMVVLSFGYLALSLGATRLRPLDRITRHGDFSFGLYLYAWPVQQALIFHHNWPEPILLWHLLATLALTSLFAVLSWFCVEKPALSLKGRRARVAPTGRPA